MPDASAAPSAAPPAPPAPAFRRGAGGKPRAYSSVGLLISDCHFGVQPNHFIPGFLSYSVAFCKVIIGFSPTRTTAPCGCPGRPRSAAAAAPRRPRTFRGDRARRTYGVFGVFGTALQEKIGVFHESSKNDTENSKCIVGGAAAAVSDATERGQQRPPSTARRPQQPLNE